MNFNTTFRCAYINVIDKSKITHSDLLVINKIDLAPYVGASLEVMESDTKKMRGKKPFVFTNLKKSIGVDTVINFIINEGML